MTRRIPLPHAGKAAIGTGLAGAALTALASAPERLGHLFRRRYPTVAVTGMTGVGKTALADRLARRSGASSTAEVGSAVMERYRSFAEPETTLDDLTSDELSAHTGGNGRRVSPGALLAVVFLVILVIAGISLGDYTST